MRLGVSTAQSREEKRVQPGVGFETSSCSRSFPFKIEVQRITHKFGQKREVIAPRITYYRKDMLVIAVRSARYTDQ